MQIPLGQIRAQSPLQIPADSQSPNVSVAEGSFWQTSPPTGAGKEELINLEGKNYLSSVKIVVKKART